MTVYVKEAPHARTARQAELVRRAVEGHLPSEIVLDALRDPSRVDMGADLTGGLITGCPFCGRERGAAGCLNCRTGGVWT